MKIWRHTEDLVKTWVLTEENLKFLLKNLPSLGAKPYKPCSWARPTGQGKVVFPNRGDMQRLQRDTRLNVAKKAMDIQTTLGQSPTKPFANPPLASNVFPLRDGYGRFQRNFDAAREMTSWYEGICRGNLSCD